MKYEFNQYYYTAAPDLFNKSRKNGWGIFGSSTPDHNIENERAEQISKDWVPMRLEEEKAFPIEYVMYYEDRYIAGGATSCSTLIEGDNRPNTWTHVMVPEKRGEESFLSCLSISSFDKVQRKDQKIRLDKVMVPYDSELESRSGLKSWQEECSDAYFLKMLLSGFSGSKRILITDRDLSEDDFEAYQLLARKMMYHIYYMMPGCWRKELNFIAPMMPKYFRLSSEKPKGARFYFGPEDPQEQYDLVISMQQGRKLEIRDFYDSMLTRMSELLHEHNELYEEIGERFRKSNYAANEKDYIWHFIFEMVENEIPIDWSKFGLDEYQEAYNQAWMDEGRRNDFLKITAVLLETREDIAASSDFFSIYCRMMRAFSSEMNPEIWEKVIRQAVQWIMRTEGMKENLLEQYLQILSEAGIRSDIETEIQGIVMQESTQIQKKAGEILEHLTTAEEMELWWTAYSPLKEVFSEKIEQKLSDLLIHSKTIEQKEQVLDLDDQIFEGKVRSALASRLLKKLKIVTFQDMKQWQLWETGKEELKLLSPGEYQKKNQEWQKLFLDQVRDPAFREEHQNDIREIALELGTDWDKIQEELEAEEKKRKQRETRMASDEELLEQLLSINYSQNQEQYHYVLDNISSRILKCESLKDEVQFNLFCFYYICYPDASREKKDKFWQLCTLEWFPKLEQLLQDPAAEILKDVLDYEDMPFEGRLFFLYHSSMQDPLEDAKRAIRRQLKTFSPPERETAKYFFSQGDGQVRRILIQELNQSDKNQITANIQLIIKSAFWIAAALLVYEGIGQLDKIHPIAAVAAWVVVLAGCLSKLLLSIKKKKEVVQDDMLLFGGLLWISCGAVIRALCGVIGTAVYLAVLLIVSLVVLLASSRQNR